jgi:Bacterial SH3 domain
MRFAEKLDEVPDNGLICKSKQALLAKFNFNRIKGLMEQRQETKSLPRNRKCGNCRYFEPAPLWRKGWCRNPRLYDRRANHLVDASSIDCEQVFRARIYWEPIPTPDESDRLISPFNVNTFDNNEYGLADGGRNLRPANDGVLRPTQGKPAINRNERTERAQPLQAEPVITDREKAEAAPNIVKKESQFRKWLLANIPYYNKVDGVVARVNWLAALPWIVIGLLAFIILINIGGGGNNSNNPSTNGTPAPQATGGSGNFAPGLGNIPTQAAVTQAPGSASKASPTPTLSNAIPTQPPQPTPTKAAVTTVRAKVINTGTAKTLNMRSDPSKKDEKNIIDKIPEGTIVEIIGGPTPGEGLEWWQIKYNNKTGWAAKEFLEQVKQ